MANVKISELTAAAALDGTESSPVVQSAATKKTTISAILTWIKTQIITWTAAHAFDVNSAGDAVRISQAGTGNALVVEDVANPDSTPFVIDAAGRVIAGHTSALIAAASITPNLQVPSASGSASSAALMTFANGASSAPFLMLCHSKNAAIGGHTLASSGDLAGNLSWSCSDGVAFIRTAQITSEVDGTPGTNDMPGRLMFATTPDGASAPTERMRITSGGFVGIGVTAPLSELHVNGSATSVDIIRITSAGDAAQQEIGIGFTPASATVVNPSAAVRALEFDGSDLRASLTFYTRDSNSDVAPTERMRITSGGNILIGTTTDDGTKLQVNGNAVISSQLKFSGSSASINNANNTGQIDIDHAPADGTSAALLRMFRNTNTAGSTRFNINLGDGTTTSNHQLAGKGVDNYLCGNNGNLTIGGVTANGKLSIQGDHAKPLTQQKSTAAVTAPGAGYGMLRWENGTNAGTLKLVAYSGTSTTGVTIVDNVGAGN